MSVVRVEGIPPAFYGCSSPARDLDDSDMRLPGTGIQIMLAI